MKCLKGSPAVLERVAELWRSGISSMTIYRTIAAEQLRAGQPVTYRTVRRWIRKVEAKYAKVVEEEREAERNKMHGALVAFLERAISEGDLRAQGVALDRLCRFLGLDAPAKVALQADVHALAGVDFANPDKAREYLTGFYAAHPELTGKAPEALPEPVSEPHAVEVEE